MFVVMRMDVCAVLCYRSLIKWSKFMTGLLAAMRLASERLLRPAARRTFFMNTCVCLCVECPNQRH